jgi:hypothetical protein
MAAGDHAAISSSSATILAAFLPLALRVQGTNSPSGDSKTNLFSGFEFTPSDLPLLLQRLY